MNINLKRIIISGKKLYVGLIRKGRHDPWKIFTTGQLYAGKKPLKLRGPSHQRHCAYINLKGVYSNLEETNCYQTRGVICEHDPCKWEPDFE